MSTHCNIRHKYRYDNDLFMVIGEIKGHQLLTASELKKIKLSVAHLEENIRNYLADNMSEVEIAPEQVSCPGTTMKHFHWILQAPIASQTRA